jgi:hypothetical protein
MAASKPVAAKIGRPPTVGPRGTEKKVEVGMSLALWESLRAQADKHQRSVAWAARKAIERGIR